MTHQSLCHSYVQSSDGLVVTEVVELESDHEEADTRLISHAHHASTNYNKIIIKSPDTIVFIIALGSLGAINSDLYFATGTQNKKRIIHVNKISEYWGSPVCSALIGIRAFTGAYLVTEYLCYRCFFVYVSLRIITAQIKFVFNFKPSIFFLRENKL